MNDGIGYSGGVPVRIVGEVGSVQIGDGTVASVDMEVPGRVQRPGLQSGGTQAQVRPSILDIVMLVHDQYKWADLAIRAVEAHTANPYRLIIVDSASVLPETEVMLAAAEQRGHTVIRLAENRSFSNGVNVGVGAGSSKFVCILNDDALVTEGWDSAMMQDASEKMVGLVGARSNYVSGAQGDPSFTGEPPYLVFVCVALRRELWSVFGPMDEETFDGFSSEDIDYSWRVQKAGYKLKVSKAFVLHAGSRSLAASNNPDALARLTAKYNARLVDKWGKAWAVPHSKIAERVLVVSFHAEEWTRVAFLGSFVGLKRSDGVTFEFMNQTRAPIHIARQAICDYALDSGYDILVMVDDDATFPSDAVKRLLAHKKDVVTALAYQRKPPYLPCIYELGEDKLLGNPMQNVEHTGLRKVDISGLHFSAVRTNVIKRLRDGMKDADGKVVVPGTRQYFGGFENKVGEDFAFALNCKKIGVQLYCDTEFIAGHIGSAVVVDEDFKKKFDAGLLPPLAK